MTAAQKFSEERDGLKHARQERILRAAFTLFSQKGIDTIAMTDIARLAEIGVASLYRYYETKEEIAIRTAIWAWEEQKVHILPEMDAAGYAEADGRGQLQLMLRKFVELYEQHPDFLRFISFFDSYAVRSGIDSARLADYAQMITSVQQIVTAAISRGIADGSIRGTWNADDLYFAIMHPFFCTAQKLSLNGTMLGDGMQADGGRELSLLAELLLTAIGDYSRSPAGS